MSNPAFENAPKPFESLGPPGQAAEQKPLPQANLPELPKGRISPKSKGRIAFFSLFSQL